MNRNKEGNIDLIKMLEKPKSAIAKLFSLVENNVQIELIENLHLGKEKICDLERATRLKKAEIIRQLNKLIENQLVLATLYDTDFPTLFKYTLTKKGEQISKAYAHIFIFATGSEPMFDDILKTIQYIEHKKRGH